MDFLSAYYPHMFLKERGGNPTVLRDQRRTKIVCTLGPASDGDIMPRLLAAGMNVARLNFSHGTLEEHGARIKRLRELAAAEGSVSYTHLRAHETVLDLVCRL